MEPNAYFLEHLKETFTKLQQEQNEKFPDADSVRVDIHCHDGNSDVPDERMARMLRLPETWSTTDEVIACLERNGAAPLTISNHNNAKSCFTMMDEGRDMLSSAEFTCGMPDFDVKLHVLVYGFTRAEEEKLLNLRHNLYRFLEYVRDRDLVSVWAHPMFFYQEGKVPPLRYLERLSLMFDNIEVWNGQRDAWQNLLTARFVESLNEERIIEIAKQEHFSPAAFCRRPFIKQMTGGSDCHMAMFAGSSGVRFHIPDLRNRRERMSLSRLVLESFKRGEFSWFGMFTSEMKLTAAVLDYFCQVVEHMEDPGLIRLLLHKGKAEEKLVALGVINGVMELRRHKYTSRFLSTFHNAMHGKRPGFILRKTSGKEFKPFVEHLDRIALASRKGAQELSNCLDQSIPTLESGLLKLFAGRVEKNFSKESGSPESFKENPIEFIERFEIPAYVRELFSRRDTGPDNGGEIFGAALLDGLPFPALAASFLGVGNFVGAHAMYKNRPLLDEVSKKLGDLKQPSRVLWLTDTLFDRNGVSTFLRLLLKEIQKRDLPIDIATVSNVDHREAHLVSIPSVATLSPAFYKEQPIQFCDLTALHRLFSEKKYDRLVCSTEGPMGLAALYLRSAFSIPSYFYMHTDWIDFAERVLSVDRQTKDRMRRLLRAYYKKFDGVFVLNEEHQRFLESEEMGIAFSRIHKTSHWAEETFKPSTAARYRLFPNARADTPIVMFAGRVSEEKGVMELPFIFRRIRHIVPSSMMVVAGDGPALGALKRALPEAVYTGWIDTEMLAQMYGAADALLLPSRFDTFGNVVLEAHACGLPVIAYNTKGPRDIILEGKTGFLVDGADEMATKTALLLLDTKAKWMFRKNAKERALDFNVDDIVAGLVSDLGLAGGAMIPDTARSASASPIERHTA